MLTKWIGGSFRRRYDTHRNERSATLNEGQPSRLITVQWRQTDVTRKMLLLREPTGHIVYTLPLLTSTPCLFLIDKTQDWWKSVFRYSTLHGTTELKPSRWRSTVSFKTHLNAFLFRVTKHLVNDSVMRSRSYFMKCSTSVFTVLCCIVSVPWKCYFNLLHLSHWTCHVSVHCFNVTASTGRHECLVLQVQDKIQPAMNKTLSKYQDGKIHMLVHQCDVAHRPST